VLREKEGRTEKNLDLCIEEGFSVREGRGETGAQTLGDSAAS